MVSRTFPMVPRLSNFPRQVHMSFRMLNHFPLSPACPEVGSPARRPSIFMLDDCSLSFFFF
jgi:hypothetical protein